MYLSTERKTFESANDDRWCSHWVLNCVRYGRRDESELYVHCNIYFWLPFPQFLSLIFSASSFHRVQNMINYLLFRCVSQFPSAPPICLIEQENNQFEILFVVENRSCVSSKSDRCRFSAFRWESEVICFSFYFVFLLFFLCLYFWYRMIFGFYEGMRVKFSNAIPYVGLLFFLLIMM